MKKIFVVVLILMVLTACQPSEEAIQQAIAQTEAAKPTETAIPTLQIFTETVTKTIAPTLTTQPIVTKSPTIGFSETPSFSEDELIQRFLDGINELIMTIAGNEVDSINLLRMDNYVLEVELKTRWASKDSQPDVSYEIVKYVSLFAEAWLNPDSLFKDLNPDGFDLSLTTYSIDGDYRYSSYSNFETLLKVYKKSISYDEWVQLSSAGFK